MRNKLYIVLAILLFGGANVLAQTCYEDVEHSYQIRKGDYIEIRGKKYTEAGTFRDTIKAVSPDICDTVETIYISFAKRYDFYETKRFCGDTTFDWRCAHIEQPGEYECRYTSVYGMDSVYHLSVFFDDFVHHYYETKYGCSNKLPYIWNGLKLYKECDTVRTLKSLGGCDSIVHLTFRLVNPPQKTEQTIQFCKSEGFFTHGQQVREERTFTDTFPTWCGCDSIVDTILIPYSQSFFQTELQQHFTGQPYNWRGYTFTEDGYYYDTLPNRSPEGCDSIYELHLVTKYDSIVSRDLCVGDTAHYKSSQGTEIIGENTDKIERYKTVHGGDSIITYSFRFTPKIIHQDAPITICGNEKYIWVYDSLHVMEIDGKDYRNQKEVSVSTVEMPLDKCEVAQMQVTVVPYYLKDSVVVACNDEIEDNPVCWVDHYGKQYCFDKQNQDTIINDTINAPVYHEPGQEVEIGGCDSIVRFHFISNNKCTDNQYYLCPGGKIKVDNIWYDSVGSYRNKLGNDIIHRFTIDTVPDPILSDTNICISHTQLPFTFMGARFSKKVNTVQKIDTVLPIRYAQQKCDSFQMTLHLTIYPNDTAELQTYHFCANERISVWTRTHKELTTKGYHVDTLRGHCDLQRGDSIFPYFIYVDPAYASTKKDSLKPNATYLWTYQGRDSVLTEPGIYVDSNLTVTDCDSILTLVLNENKPYYQLTNAIGCDNELPYIWRTQTFYHDTTLIDTVYNVRKDSIFELRLTIAPSYDSLRYISLLPDSTSTYNFYGHVLTLKDTGSVFVQPFETVAGCDSTERVIIVPVQPVYKDTVLCSNQYIIVDGDTITHSYSDTTITEGSYSITIYNLTHKSVIVYDQQKQITRGTSFQWNTCSKGLITISDGGVHLDTCVNQFGCDSIIRLTVIVAEPQYHATSVEWCYHDLPYRWHGQEYYQTGTYLFTDKTPLGQNYSDTLHLTVIPAIEQSIHIDTCFNGDPIRINGKDYYKESAFVDTLIAVSTHCDSIIHYTLRFHTSIDVYENHQITEGETYYWHGQECKENRQYIYRVDVPDHCDTVYNLFLKVCPKMESKSRTINACYGEVVLVNGDTIRTTATTSEPNYTDNGCLYKTQVNVIFHNRFFEHKKDSIYPGGTYHWRGRKLTNQGVYYDSLSTVQWGCDSVYQLSLSLSQLTYTSTNKLVCRDSVPYQHKGYGFYYNDTTFADTTLNDRGWPCHIHYWEYKISDYCSDFDTEYLCPGEYKIIDGLRVDTTGIYSVPHQTLDFTGALVDSLHRFKVLPAKIYRNYFKLEGCDSIVHSGHVYRYRGNDEPFTQILTYPSKQGCDSIEELDLTIHSSKRHTVLATTADYQLPYRFAGQDFTETGVYPIQFDTQYGCDSIVTLDLKVKTTLNDTSYMVYCKGNPEGITIFGKTYWPDSRMTIDSIFQEGDNPVRHTVIVNVNTPFTITHFDDQASQVVCAANKVTFYVSYQALSNSSSSLPTKYDVDFFVGDLDASPKHATYSVKGKTTIPIEMDGLGTSVNPGYYSYRVSFYAEGCSVSDTSFVGTVLVRYPADVMEANWTDVVALVNENYNVGHWSFIPPYAWQVKNSAGEDKTNLIASSDPNQPYIVSSNLRENDVVIATLYRSNYARPIPSCPFTFVPVQYSTNNAPVVVYPTATRKSSDVHIEVEQPGQWQLINTTGHCHTNGVVVNGNNQVTVPGVDGCYLLKVTLQDGTQHVQRLIVY